MKKPWLLLLAGCLNPAQDARIAAFGAANERGDLEAAAQELSTCLYTGHEDEQFLCRDLCADVRFRQRRWVEAATLYGLAFEIRDRIAKQQGYGTPSLQSLVSWGYALSRTQHPAEAKQVLARALAQDNSGEAAPTVTFAHLVLADIAKAENDRATEAREHAAATSSCTTKDTDYLRILENNRLGNGYLPVDGWIALGDACGERSFYRIARDQARIEHDQAGFATAMSRLP